MKKIAVIVSTAAALAGVFLLDQPAPAASTSAAAVDAPRAAPASRRTQAVAAPMAAQPTNAVPSSSRLEALPPRSWEIGLERVYRVSAQRRLQFVRNGGARDGATPAPVAIGIDGELAFVVKETDGELIHLQVTLRGATRRGATGGHDAAPELEAPFIATFERTGHLVAAHFASGTSSDARSQLQALVASLQLVITNPSAAEWTTEERDAAGEYEARWSRLGPSSVQREKRRYQRVVTVDGLIPTSDVGRYDVSSNETFDLDRAGWPSAYDATETLNAGAASDPMTIAMSSSLTARLVRSEDGPRATSSIDWERYETSEVASAPSFEDARRNIDEQRVGDATLESLVGHLSSIPDRDDPRSPALAREHARLASFFRLNPGAAADAMSRVARGQVDAITARSLIGALGSAGTPEAQSALASALGDPALAREHRLGATVALGMTERPNAESVGSLMTASSSEDPELAHASALAAGSAIQRARTEGSADVSDAVADLIERLGSATSPGEAMVLLDALGNAGDVRALPAIRPYLAIGHVGLRATAVGALRFIASPEVDPTLDVALETDFAPEVRSAALFAITVRDVSAHLPALLRAVKAEPTEPVRNALVAALLPLAAQPEVQSALNEIAASDSSEAIRAAAASVP